MQRVTVTVDPSLAAFARADIEAGRASSMSAWVADAMRRKALARVELVSELESMQAEDPFTEETIDWLAAVVGRPSTWVAERLAPPPPAGSNAG